MTPRRLEARVLLQAEHELGESPIWFDERWWWVEIESGVLYSCDAAGGQSWSHSFGRRVTAAAPMGDDCWLIVFERSIVRWDPDSGNEDLLARLEGEPLENRFNDGKWDPAGRFVVGTLNQNGLRNCAGLYSLDLARGLRRLLDGLHLSNGLAWSMDGRTFFHVDSLAYEIAAYDYDLESGGLSNRRIVVRVPEEMGLPDGMDIDPDGNLWVAHWGGGAVRCWAPDEGRCQSKILLPCTQPTSCRFGGPERDHLIITSARSGLRKKELAHQPLAGSVFLLQLNDAVWNCRRLPIQNENPN